jgi:glycosyltransferase involved in cell wall biosynthesis
MFKRKGVQYALRALARFPGTFDIDIVGDGPYLSTLVALAKSLRISVKFWGHLDNDSSELAVLYQRASIFVFTSDAENFPVVLLEAMSAGAAIISTQGTGCAEVVGGTGLLVPVRDVEAIRHELERLAANPALAAELGQSARARVRANFGWASVVDRHLIEYAQARWSSSDS